MAHPLPDNDFRSRRWVLDPDDFVFASTKRAQPPQNLVDEESWGRFISLPTDVSIMTSNDHGDLIRVLATLWENWILSDNTGEYALLTKPMLDVNDELHAAVFDALHGYYRQGISSLRTALELGVTATYINFNTTEGSKWDDGTLDITFGRFCNRLTSDPIIDALEQHLQGTTGETIFARGNQNTGQNPGWARTLYGILCNSVHGKPGYTLFDAWQSNGPVYSSEDFVKFSNLYFETVCLLIILVKLIDPQFEMTLELKTLFDGGIITRSSIADEAYKYLFR
jgi:hypothetical protein